MDNQSKSVYIHIPFCNYICNYCDFCKFYYDEKIVDKYLKVLEEEIKSRYMGETINTIYIGGGTPSSLNIRYLQKLFDIINIFNLKEEYEFTVECNPDNLTLEKIKLLAKYKVNRVSLGVQSFNNDVLKTLGRKHTKNDVINVVKLLKDNQINNINIDLIYGVNENIKIIEEDLDDFLNLNISHLSYYSLIIEEHTIIGINNRNYINEDIEYQMYKYIENRLEKAGYEHYEISNYAKKGYQSLHNLTYWNNNYYYGFGLSAVSYLEDKRIINTKNMGLYLENKYIYDIIKETREDKIKNEVMLNLRKLSGLNLNTFYNKYSNNFYDVFNIRDLMEKKILIEEWGNIKINKECMYISNKIIMEIEERGNFNV